MEEYTDQFFVEEGCEEGADGGDEGEAHDFCPSDAAEAGFEEPVYMEFPEMPLLGPPVKGLGRVKEMGKGKTSGQIETDKGEIVSFNAMNVIGGKEPQVRDHVAYGVEETEQGPVANVVVPLQVHQGSPMGVELAKLKSYSAKNKYGFVQLLNSEELDVHFHTAVCCLTDGLVRDRMCVAQVDRSVVGRPRCCFLQPLLDSHELQELRAAGLANAAPVGVGGPVPTAEKHLPVVDLTPMGLPQGAAQDPQVIRAAQEAAAAAARRAVAGPHGSQPHQALLQGGFTHSYPYPTKTVEEQKEAAENDHANYVGTHHGVVKSWSTVNKYGFVLPDTGGKDVHVQLNVLNGQQFLSTGERVSFTYDVSELPRRRASSVWKSGPAPQTVPAVASNKAPAAVRPVRIVQSAPYGKQAAPTGPVAATLPPPPPPPPGGQAAVPQFDPEATGTGAVKSYFALKGFGFIVCDVTGKDIFFSTQHVQEAGLPGANQGDKLGFATAPGETRATSVWAL